MFQFTALTLTGVIVALRAFTEWLSSQNYNIQVVWLILYPADI